MRFGSAKRISRQPWRSVDLVPNCRSSSASRGQDRSLWSRLCKPFRCDANFCNLVLASWMSRVTHLALEANGAGSECIESVLGGQSGDGLVKGSARIVPGRKRIRYRQIGRKGPPFMGGDADIVFRDGAAAFHHRSGVGDLPAVALNREDWAGETSIREDVVGFNGQLGV